MKYDMLDAMHRGKIMATEKQQSCFYEDLKFHFSKNPLISYTTFNNNSNIGLTPKCSILTTVRCDILGCLDQSGTKGRITTFHRSV